MKQQILVGLCVLALAGGAWAAEKLPFQDTALPFEQRVADLVGRMTLEEKVGEMMNGTKGIPRLGVPAYDWWNECLHGVGRNGVATVYPQAIGLAATWDPELIHAVAAAISTEARAKHHEALRHDVHSIYNGLTFWTPNINMFRDPRWGRGQETYGEDPFLTARIGVAFVTGLQGNDPKYLKVVSTPKHFAVHSGPEPSRHTFDAVVPERDFYEYYLPHFEACFREGGAWSVMGAYNRTYGEPCCSSTLLLQKLLRDAWGFRGYVVSDCAAIGDIWQNHKVVATAAEAAARAVKAGCDLECGGTYKALPEAVAKGLITEAELDTSLKRLFLARFKLGMFDPPEMVPFASIPMSKNDSPEHAALALRTAQESIVLLKNNGVLPLSPDLKRIAVIGPNANSLPILLGNYNGSPSHPVKLLEGIKAAADHRTVDYAMGCGLVSAQLEFAPIPETQLRANGQNGLKAEWFGNENLEGAPAVTRQDREINFFWAQGNPVSGLPVEHISARWTGELIAPADGEYALAVRGDDGYRLFINGKKVIDNWRVARDHESTRNCTVELKAGQPAKLKLEYFQHERNAEVALLWAFASTSAQEEAFLLAKSADVIVFIGGISPQVEGEEMKVPYDGFLGGDRTKIELPTVQLDMLKALKLAGKPIIFVCCSGSAIAMPWAAEHLDAIVQTWYPGQAGGTALADVLLGKVNPSGRLPVTFYASTTNLPPFEDYTLTNRTYRFFKGEPQWPFGHGLSYTTFRYEGLSAEIRTNDITIKARLVNTGARDGDEVVQLYVRDNFTPEPRANQRLVGFQRVSIKAGATADVTLNLHRSDLRLWDVARKEYRTYPGTYEFLVGGSAADIRARTTLEVLNPPPPPIKVTKPVVKAPPPPAKVQKPASKAVKPEVKSQKAETKDPKK